MSNILKVHTMADYIAEGKSPEVLFWIGCAGSFDDRAKKITKAFVKILNSINVDFAVLGQEESCSGDPAKRAGNEFLFQMQAISNIEVLNSYDIKTIVTTCPHCFNTLKNEYPSLLYISAFILFTFIFFMSSLAATVSGWRFKGRPQSQCII